MNKFRQEVDRPGEIIQETPQQRREREYKGEPAPEIKQKTPEEIQAEKAAIEKDYREKYASAYKMELAITESTLHLMFAGNTSQNLEPLVDKVLLVSNHLKMSSTRFSNSKI